MLTLTASILETIIIRTSVFAGQQLLNVAYYGGMSLYNWYNPTMTETEILQQQVKLLQNELNDLKSIQYKNIESQLLHLMILMKLMMIMMMTLMMTKDDENDEKNLTLLNIKMLIKYLRSYALS